MSNSNFHINIEFQQTPSIDIKGFIDGYRNDDSVLRSIIYNYGDLNNFDSNTWIMLDIYTNTLNYAKFYEYQPIIEAGYMNEDDLNLIKCYAVEIRKDKEDDGVCASSTLAKKLKILKETALKTNFFDINFTKEKENIVKMLAEFKTRSVDISAIKDYFEFLDGIDCLSEGQLALVSYMETNKIDCRSDKTTLVRDLPGDADIFKFSWYLKKFFSEEKDDVLTGLYMPVLIWWKVTTVIPFRPSEFSRKLCRECLVEEKGKYYLKVERIKVRISSKKKPGIPILNKLEIPKLTYMLMQEYLQRTSFDEKTKTFFSYKAYQVFKKESRKRLEDRYERDKLADLEASTHGIEEDVFIRRDLNDLINSFYSEIIEGKYNDDTIKRRLRMGDTRHLAFMSLLLQGISPIEIAMLGGHTSLVSQEHYYGHASYYVESEILEYVNETTMGKQIVGNQLRDIIRNQPDICPRSISECYKTDDGIGYCTLDLSNDKDVCEEKEVCIYCSKWWCLNTDENYEKAKQYILNKKISPLNKKLKLEEKFLKKLLEESKTVRIGTMLELDKDYEEEIMTQAKKVRGTADEIVKLRKTLMESKKNKALMTDMYIEE